MYMYMYDNTCQMFVLFRGRREKERETVGVEEWVHTRTFQEPTECLCNCIPGPDGRRIGIFVLNKLVTVHRKQL